MLALTVVISVVTLAASCPAGYTSRPSGCYKVVGTDAKKFTHGECAQACGPDASLACLTPALSGSTTAARMSSWHARCAFACARCAGPAAVIVRGAHRRLAAPMWQALPTAIPRAIPRATAACIWMRAVAPAVGLVRLIGGERGALLG